MVREANLDLAAAYIGVLTDSDGWRTPMTWQTLDDTRERRATFAAVVNGSLLDVAAELQWKNARGAGIFVTVQQTNLAGRKWEHIVAPRAVFIDADASLRRTIALPPSIVVRSQRGIHAYWKLADGELEAIPSAQRQLAGFYGSDGAVCDITRCMRVPGFFHCKGEPFAVQVEQARGDLRYPLDVVLAAHPVETPAWVVAPPLDDALVGNARAFAAWARCKEVSPGYRNHTAYVIAAEGLGRGLAEPDVRAVVLAYCDRAAIPEEAVAIMASAGRRHARYPFQPRGGRCGSV